MQARFATVRELDLGGLHLGQAMPEKSEILTEAARWCPEVCSLRLGTAQPRALWSDLARYLPMAFERSLRGWWKSRPFTLEAYGKRYDLT